MQVQHSPGPAQTIKEETKREEPWITSLLQRALNELHHTLQQTYKKDSLILTLPSKFTNQIN
jgi:hypothetical protein